MARKRPPSRTARWQQAVADARAGLDAMEAAKSTLADALSALADIQSEFSDWKDNLPENLASSALGEKLDAVCDLDLELDADSASFDELSDLVDAAEGADLPLGFGRD